MAPLSPKSQLKKQLDSLQANPNRKVVIPNAPTVKTLRAPKEMMLNVQGSSAGAGSGEFHVYKQGRRREYERIALMESEAAAEKAQKEFDERKAKVDAEAENKTSKARQRRQKKKASRKGQDKADRDDPDGIVEKAEVEFKKRKIEAAPQRTNESTLIQLGEVQEENNEQTDIASINVAETCSVSKITVTEELEW